MLRECRLPAAFCQTIDICRWYTGGPAGGSGQEVIAPAQGGDKKNKTFEALREAVEPHAREGTSEDLAEESNVFTGSARTLDGAPTQAL